MVRHECENSGSDEDANGGKSSSSADSDVMASAFAAARSGDVEVERVMAVMNLRATLRRLLTRASLSGMASPVSIIAAATAEVGEVAVDAAATAPGCAGEGGGAGVTGGCSCKSIPRTSPARACVWPLAARAKKTGAGASVASSFC